MGEYAVYHEPKDAYCDLNRVTTLLLFCHREIVVFSLFIANIRGFNANRGQQLSPRVYWYRVAGWQVGHPRPNAKGTISIHLS